MKFQKPSPQLQAAQRDQQDPQTAQEALVQFDSLSEMLLQDIEQTESRRDQKLKDLAQVRLIR